MATYCFANRGAAVPYDAPFQTCLKRNINVPDLAVTNYAKLALAASPTVPLATALSSSQFAANDILELWEVPAGFCVTHVGVRVTTAEGATCTADIGNASATQTHLLAANADGLMGTIDLNSAVTQIGLIADEDLGGSTYNQLVFVTAGSIDLTFGHNTDAAIFDVWVNGYKAF